MRTKIGLMVVLASFLAVASLSAAMAGANSVADSVADGTSVTPLAPAGNQAAPACANGIDDDGDGLIDLEDEVCETPEGTSEEPTPPAETTIPAPAPPTPPAAIQPQEEKSAGEGDTPKKNSNEVVQGDEIGGDAAKQKRGGATFNETLGDASGGSKSDGGVKAPSATGEGDQPLGGDGDGGAQFNPTGAPTLGNPTTTIAPFGPAPIGVPNFIIDSFEIPPFLLPIYQACGTEYGIPWEVLASINKIETGFGTNLNISTAGAMGWMQFLPSSWEAFGVDANGDGKKDPYNPVDAICAAANYLEVAGAKENLYDAIFAYNHADWYVQEVLLYARAYGRLPSGLVGSLTGLTEGAHFPIAADARYADEIAARAAESSEPLASSPTERGINIFAAPEAPVVAVNDGVVRKIGNSEKLGNFVVLEDTYGNRYTYAKLGNLVRNERLIVLPSGKEKRLPVESENLRPRLRALPGRVEDDGLPPVDGHDHSHGHGDGKLDPSDEISSASASQAEGEGKQDESAGKDDEKEASEPTSEPEEIRADGRIRVGSKVIAGTVLARVSARDDGTDPHINFSIRPAGKGAPRIDPKPILDGWKLLEATAIYRSKGKSPFAKRLSGAGVLLLSKEALAKRVLADDGLTIHSCGQEDIATGQIDRRVLAMLAYLRTKGFELTVTSLRCGREGIPTASGNVSEHSTGDAVDIAAINGQPVLGNQGPGSLTNQVTAELMRLQGTMTPHQVISLEDFPGPVSFPLADHADHIHVGYYADGDPFELVSPLLKPAQWDRLLGRLGEIENPDVAIRPSSSSLPADEPDGTAAD